MTTFNLEYEGVTYKLKTIPESGQIDGELCTKCCWYDDCKSDEIREETGIDCIPKKVEFVPADEDTAVKLALRKIKLRLTR